MALNSVKVLFKNPLNNYTTSVSENTTEESAKEYFIGTWFNTSIFSDDEDMQQCIGIEFINNNI